MNALILMGLLGSLAMTSKRETLLECRMIDAAARPAYALTIRTFDERELGSIVAEVNMTPADSRKKPVQYYLDGLLYGNEAAFVLTSGGQSYRNYKARIDGSLLPASGPARRYKAVMNMEAYGVQIIDKLGLTCEEKRPLNGNTRPLENAD